MSGEGFFKRWARLKATGGADEADAGTAPAPVPVSSPVPAPASAAPALRAPGERIGAEPALQAQDKVHAPSMEDAARLTPDADFSAFVARDVDKSVQRLALKKLFTDPHFNAMDGLDMYMSDYNKPSPLSPAMLASLHHAQGLVARLLDDQQKEAEARLAQEAQAEAAPAPPADAAPAEHAPQMHDNAEAPVTEAPPTTNQGTA